MKSSTFLCGGLAVLAAILVSQYASWAATTTPPETHDAFYALSVQNLDTAIEWYSGHLGFEVTSHGENEQRKGALLERPGAMLELAEFAGAVALEELGPELESHQVFGIFKLGFVVGDLDSTFDYFESAGVDILFPIVAASDGKRTFGILDPDGNIVQFFGQ